MGKQLIEGGLANCVMALGFDKMKRGSLGTMVCINMCMVIFVFKLIAFALISA